MSFVLAIAGFAALILLHELGHFTVAKAVGMRVERFSLFFGPMPLKLRRGETEYGIGVIPLGGYVKITGMSPREEIPDEVRPRAYYLQPVWKRIAVIMAGPLVNLVVAFVMLTGIFWQNGIYDGPPRQIAEVTAAPARGALRVDDVVLAADGRPVHGYADLNAIVSADRCAGPPVAGCTAQRPVTLSVRRGGSVVGVALTPRYDARAKRMLLGVKIISQHRSLSAAGSAGQSLSQLWYVTHKTVTTFATLFEPKVRKQVHGVVGIVDVTQQRFSYSTTDALYTLAVVSLSLGIINLFPFLPLDGGHVFWAVAEKVRGRRIPFEVMERAGVIGFALILVIFVIGFSNDISTLSGKGFNVR